MLPQQANFINSILLIGLGLWGYFATDAESPTALIPVAFGVVFLILSAFIKNKWVLYAVGLLTVILTLALLKPLFQQFEQGELIPIIRVGIMFIASLYTSFVYLNHLIANNTDK